MWDTSLEKLLIHVLRSITSRKDTSTTLPFYSISVEHSMSEITLTDFNQYLYFSLIDITNL